MAYNYQWRKPKIIDRAGERFGILIAREYERKLAWGGWWCDCPCGRQIWVTTTNLTQLKNDKCKCDKVYPEYVRGTKKQEEA